jgi:fructokinase
MIVSLGEALIDLIQRPDGLYSAQAGGAPANTALTIARLGGDVQFAGRISSFGFGPGIRERLETNGVKLDLLVAAPQPTTVALFSVGRSGLFSVGVNRTRIAGHRSLHFPPHSVTFSSVFLFLQRRPRR